MVNHSSSSPGGLPPPPPPLPPLSPPVVVPWSSSVTVFSSVSSFVVHESCAPRMAAAARLCRLLPTGRKNVVASLVIDFRLHVRQAQVVSVRVPLTIYGRIQLTQNSQVRSVLPLFTEGTQECRGLLVVEVLHNFYRCKNGLPSISTVRATRSSNCRSVTL